MIFPRRHDYQEPVIPDEPVIPGLTRNLLKTKESVIPGLTRNLLETQPYLLPVLILRWIPARGPE